MAEGEFWQETLRRKRKQRVETLVAGVIGGILAGVEHISDPSRGLIRDAFDWADAIIRESDRREKDGDE